MGPKPILSGIRRLEEDYACEHILNLGFTLCPAGEFGKQRTEEKGAYTVSDLWDIYRTWNGR
jgi:hypothetical protein